MPRPQVSMLLPIKTYDHTGYLCFAIFNTCSKNPAKVVLSCSFSGRSLIEIQKIFKPGINTDRVYLCAAGSRFRAYLSSSLKSRSCSARVVYVVVLGTISFVSVLIETAASLD